MIYISCIKIFQNGKAPQSVSTDGGDTWIRTPSQFPSISSGRRFTLLRLRYSPELGEYPGVAPILFIGFASDGFMGKSGEGTIVPIEGLFAAISFDEGKTWEKRHRRVISNLRGKAELDLVIAPWQRTHTLGVDRGQGEGYMTATQTPDGLIHITDAKIVYTFNLAWILE